ncbi:hypothetical protein GGS23DRAFT_546536 [Durotheca rogersii]|uniref:uncharacterized protein n=1 Tax=Durotheca rogersii TaxID=419775 RepID=UPI00221FBAAD|nr:uncharacterized protein GGS23DRAFT_546536 [Durotheca rogersii]KAI5868652.1 hypothetical protein GGS23DRAFT_546536 [Durotheca rogersii]
MPTYLGSWLHNTHPCIYLLTGLPASQPSPAPSLRPSFRSPAAARMTSPLPLESVTRRDAARPIVRRPHPPVNRLRLRYPSRATPRHPGAKPCLPGVPPMLPPSPAKKESRVRINLFKTGGYHCLSSLWYRTSLSRCPRRRVVAVVVSRPSSLPLPTQCQSTPAVPSLEPPPYRSLPQRAAALRLRQPRPCIHRAMRKGS